MLLKACIVIDGTRALRRTTCTSTVRATLILPARRFVSQQGGPAWVDIGGVEPAPVYRYDLKLTAPPAAASGAVRRGYHPAYQRRVVNEPLAYRIGALYQQLKPWMYPRNGTHETESQNRKLGLHLACTGEQLGAKLETADLETADLHNITPRG